MKPRWLLEGLSDVEYKKYMFLAYLNRVNSSFEKTELYPSFSELMSQYAYIKQFCVQKRSMQSQFPLELMKIDVKTGKLMYQSSVKERQESLVLQEVIDFAMPKMEQSLVWGRELFDNVEDHIRINPIGILPSYKKEGIVFLKTVESSLIHLFKYKVEELVRLGERFHGIHLILIDSFRKKIGETYEVIRNRVGKEFSWGFVPAMYMLEFNQVFPFQETMVPVAKRVMMVYMANKK